jgi:hypothetical protein
MQKLCLVVHMKTNDQTYLDLVAWRDKLDSRQTELQAELEDVTRKLESVSTALALLDGTPPPLSHRAALVEGSISRGTIPIDVASLRGLKQVEALTKIAQHSGGQFQTTVAKKLLLQAGLISNPKNANNILFSVIQRSGKFERVEPGVYRLIGQKPERPERPQLELSNE